MPVLTWTVLNIRVNVCWCILILRRTSKRHTPENAYDTPFWEVAKGGGDDRCLMSSCIAIDTSSRHGHNVRAQWSARRER